ncbi:hypothetical protein ACIP93_14090 [Streptomyces sp. NPDC088745]|uniref:hypothetical protein n=1 Tax=Streptomyces sp. NPDC088745 TaxID=3365884 RepID=UPI00381EE78D
MTNLPSTPKSRFLVLNDYGMGGAWWWIHARSAREVLETFAEVEVIDSPEAIERAGRNLDEVDIDEPAMPPGLDELRTMRDAQRGRPGFGALADRSIVHLRRRWDGDEPATYFMEVGSDGRRLRQVELSDDGTALRSSPDDWSFNSPVVDLFDPEWADLEISPAEFEAAWLEARQVGGER